MNINKIWIYAKIRLRVIKTRSLTSVGSRCMRYIIVKWRYDLKMKVVQTCKILRMTIRKTEY